MTRRERQGLYYLADAARALQITPSVLAKALYAPTLCDRLTRQYRRAWQHPRRLRVLTAADLALVRRYLRARRPSAPARAQGSARTRRASSG